MKKTRFLIALSALTMAAIVRAETITIGGTAYSVTREVDREVVSGLQYIKLSIPSFGSYGAKVYITIADLSRSDLHAEYINANGTSKGVATLTSMANRLTSDGHKVVAGANANFWITTETPWSKQLKYSPWGNSVRNGMLITEPNQRYDAHCGGPAITGTICVDPNGKVYINKMNHTMDLYNPRLNHTMDLDQCNRIVRAGTGSIYNSFYGSSNSFKPVNTDDSSWPIVEGVCTEMLCDLVDGESWNAGGDTRFIVKEIRQNAGTGTLGSHDMAFVGRDSYATIVNQYYQVGDEVVIKQRYTFTDGSTPLIEQGTSGNVVTLIDGVRNDDQIDPCTDNGNSTYNTSRYARTIYATDETQTKLITLVCENLSGSVTGLTTKNLTDIASYFGAKYASQVDCGGSSQMYVDGSQVSKSTDSSGVRSCHSGMFIVSTAGATEAADPSFTTTMANTNFGELAIGESSSKTFTVTGSDLTDDIKLALSGSGAASFSLSTSSILKANGSGSFTITFSPKDTGQQTATLTISTTGATSKTFTVSGVGSGVSDTSTYPDPALNAGVTASDSYTLNKAYTDKDIAELSGMTVKRVIARGDYLYILGLNGTAATVVVYNHTTGKTVRTLGTTNCVGDILPLSDIAITGDGFLVGCAKVNQAFQGTAAVLFYRWSNDSDGVPAGEAIQWNITNNSGNWSNAYCGESMCYSGTLTGGTIYYTAQTTSSQKFRIVALSVGSDTFLTNAWHMKLETVSGYTLSDFGGSVLLFASPNSDSNFILNGPGKVATEFVRAEAAAGVPTVDSALTTTVDTKAMHTGMFRYGGKIYMVAPTFTSGAETTTGCKLFDITGGLANVAPVDGGNKTVSTSTTTNPACCVGTAVQTKSGSTIQDNQLAMLMVRDGQVSKYITPSSIVADPNMTTTMSDHDFGEVSVGSTASTSFTISAADLTGAVSIALSGTNASMFAVSATSLAAASANGTKVTISYAPTAAGSHSATLTVKTDGVSALTYKLTGSGVAVEDNSTFQGEITGLEEKWNYSEIKDNLSDASWLELSSSSTYSRSMTLYDGAICVSNASTGKIGSIVRLNPYTGEQIGTMSSSGISKVGTHILSSIKALGSRMYGSNVATAAQTLTIYRWDSSTADPVVALSTTDHGDVRVGDILSVWGDDNEGRLMFCDATSNNQKIVYYNVKNGVVDSTPNIISLASAYGGSGAANGLVYNGDGTYWLFSKDYLPVHIAADGSEIERFTTSAIPDKYGSDGVFFEYGGNSYLAATEYDESAVTSGTALDYGMLCLVDYTNGVTKATHIGAYPASGLGTLRNTTFNTSVAYQQIESTHQVNLWVLIPFQGIAYYSYGGDATGVHEVANSISADKMMVRRYPSMIKILGVEPASVQIYSISGAEVLRVGAVDEVDTAALAAGVYILRVQDKQGRVHTAKVSL